MRTSTTQNILYDYRHLNLREEVKFNLENAFHLRRDFTKIEEEENFTIGERLLAIGGILGAVSGLYFILSYLA